MLITTDLHLTDRARDEYRWELFPWLAEQLKKGGHSDLLILGDLTDAKDGHSAKLVNRIIDTLRGLPATVHIIKGNHDYADEDCPFFRFLDPERCGDPDAQVRFYPEPRVFWAGELDILALPHTSNPDEDWSALNEEMFADADMIVCHQTFKGANAGKGYKLDGISSTWFSEYGVNVPVLSGDIHVPQDLGDVTYVGCPYPIAFGDSFNPSVVSLDIDEGFQVKRLPVPTIRKLSLDVYDPEELYDYDLKKGDQLKLRVHMPRSEFGTWWEARRDAVHEIAKECGAVIYSAELREKPTRRRARMKDPKAKAPEAVSPSEVMTKFCQTRGVDEAVEFSGREVLDL